MPYKPKWYDSAAWLRLAFIEQGKSISEIAKMAGISDETVRKLLIKHNLKRSK